MNLALRAVDVQAVLTALGQEHPAVQLGDGPVVIEQQGGGVQVDLLFGKLGGGANGFRVPAHQTEGHAHGVAAQVVHGSAEGLSPQADVGVRPAAGQKGGLQIANFADGPGFDLRPDGGDNGAVEIGEGLHQEDAVLLRRAEHGLRLGLRYGQGLFAQHVLAGLQGPHRPGAVQVVGQRDIDGLDLWVGQQFFIAAIRLFKAEFPLEGLGLLQAPARDSVQGAVVRRFHGGNGLAPGNVRRAQDAPVDLSHCRSSMI